MQRLFAGFLLAISGCVDGADAPGPSTAQGSWLVRPAGDLNAFFDCLSDDGATLVAAHRGGPTADFPENAIETFENTLSLAPAFLEIDVATSSDGILYLMHDDTLERTTTGEGAANALAWADIKALSLEDFRGRTTPFHPPSFADALSWAKGKTILEIDFKQTTRYDDVIDEINRQQADDRVILIAYTLAQARLLHRLAPRAMISLSLASQSDLNRAVASGIPSDRLLGFTGVEAPDTRLFSILNNQDVEVIFGTLGGRQSIDRQIEAAADDARYAELAASGIDIIATDRPVAAQAALEKAERAAAAGLCGIARVGASASDNQS